MQPGNLDEILEKQGYSQVDPTSVQILDLSNIKAPVINTVQIDQQVNEEWLEHFCTLNQVEDHHKKTINQMLNNRWMNRGFFTLYHEKNQIVACGLGMIERKFIGIFDVVTNNLYRNQGFGEQLLLNLLQWGRDNGADHSYLAVMLRRV